MRNVWTAVIVGAVVLLATSTASACPMCSGAIGTGQSGDGSNMTAGVYYSILFMLSTPFVLTASFAFAFWRLSKQSPAHLAVHPEFSDPAPVGT